MPQYNLHFLIDNHIQAERTLRVGMAQVFGVRIDEDAWIYDRRDVGWAILEPMTFPDGKRRQCHYFLFTDEPLPWDHDFGGAEMQYLWPLVKGKDGIPIAEAEGLSLVKVEGYRYGSISSLFILDTNRRHFPEKRPL
jgi:hypothetical protein